MAVLFCKFREMQMKCYGHAMLVLVSLCCLVGCQDELSPCWAQLLVELNDVQRFFQFVKTLAKSPTFAKDPRKIQFEADVNRLFLYTSYNRLGSNAEEADAEEIIDLASKASLDDQQRQVQENIHFQVKAFCTAMDDVLLPSIKKVGERFASGSDSPRRSGLSLATGKPSSHVQQAGVPDTLSLSRVELSDRLKDLMGYTLDIKPSQIQHKEAGEGLFLRGHVDVGSVIAFYPGVIYSPAYYRYIPGYPRVDARNSYLITRYDSTIINGQPWSHGGEHRELWDGASLDESLSDPTEIVSTRSDRFWKLLSKPTRGIPGKDCGEILERRNPLAFGHFANHPAEGTLPNVMVCPYDFPLTDSHMRPYIPNLTFGGEENVRMRRFGSFWFKSGGSDDSEFDVPVIKSIVLVATRSICDEEIYLNYRLSNAKHRPAWYTPVDEEEDKRRWS